jgi:hypothetical protein
MPFRLRVKPKRQAEQLLAKQQQLSDGERSARLGQAAQPAGGPGDSRLEKSSLGDRAAAEGHRRLTASVREPDDARRCCQPAAFCLPTQPLRQHPTPPHPTRRTRGPAARRQPRPEVQRLEKVQGKLPSGAAEARRWLPVS